MAFAAAAPSAFAARPTCNQARGYTVNQTGAWRVFAERPPVDGRSSTLFVCERFDAMPGRVWRFRAQGPKESLAVPTLVGDLALVERTGAVVRTGRAYSHSMIVNLRTGRQTEPAPTGPSQSTTTWLLTTGAVVQQRVLTVASGPEPGTYFGDVDVFDSAGKTVAATGVLGVNGTRTASGFGPTGIVPAPWTGARPAGIYLTTSDGTPTRVVADGHAKGLVWQRQRLHSYRAHFARRREHPWTQWMLLGSDGRPLAFVRRLRSSLEPYTLRAIENQSRVLATLQPRSLPDFRVLSAAGNLILLRGRFEPSGDRVNRLALIGPGAPVWATPPPETVPYDASATALTRRGSVAIVEGDRVRRWPSTTQGGALVLREAPPVTIAGAHDLAVRSDGSLYVTDASGRVHSLPLDEITFATVGRTSP